MRWFILFDFKHKTPKKNNLVFEQKLPIFADATLKNNQHILWMMKTAAALFHTSRIELSDS